MVQVPAVGCGRDGTWQVPAIMANANTTCARCRAVVSEGQLLRTHICGHLLCETCWFQNPPGEENEIVHHNYCGGSSCSSTVVQVGGGVTTLDVSQTTTVNNRLPTKTGQSRPSRQGMQLWRRNIEGVRLIEAIATDCRKSLLGNMLRSQNAFQLDSGKRSKVVALEAICKIFNDATWTAPNRFLDDINLQGKIDPNSNPKQVDPQLVDKKMGEIRTLYKKACDNWKKSGSGEADLEKFVDYCTSMTVLVLVWTYTTFVV